MKFSRESRASSPAMCAGQIDWDYDRAEIIADGTVHAIGVCLGLIGAVTIVVIAVRIERIEVTPILVYVIGLVTMLALSAAYNMWPISPAKWVLRRFDHSAIYLLIAGTYTPFLAQMKSVLASTGLGLGVWLSAVIGIALKLALPGRFDRLAIVLCLLLGWSGVIAYDSLVSGLPSASVWLLAIGGIPDWLMMKNPACAGREERGRERLGPPVIGRGLARIVIVLGLNLLLLLGYRPRPLSPGWRRVRVARLLLRQPLPDLRHL